MSISFKDFSLLPWTIVLAVIFQGTLVAITAAYSSSMNLGVPMRPCCLVFEYKEVIDSPENALAERCSRRLLDNGMEETALNCIDNRLDLAIEMLVRLGYRPGAYRKQNI